MMEHDRESRCGREPIKKKHRNTILMDMKTVPAKLSEFSLKEAHSFIIIFNVFHYSNLKLTHGVLER